MRKTYFQYILALVFAGVFYVFTCAPAILWQDSGLLVYRVLHNDLEGKLGLAVAHPLYIMAGMAVKYGLPLGDLAYRVNLISAILGAVTVANFFLLLKLWLGKIWPAVIGAVTLLVSWTFWQNAVIAEVYTLYTVFMSAELIMLLMYVRTKKVGYLYWLGLFNGLAVANHMWGSFGFACYAIFLGVLFVRKEIRVKDILVIALLWVIGAMPYEYLIVRNIIVTGDIKATLASAAFGNLWQDRVLNPSVSLKIVFENIIFVVLNFPTPNFVLLFVGLAVLWKKSPSKGFANILAALLVLYFAFAFRYTVPDRHAFFLPFYCVAAVIIALGADAILERLKSKSAAVVILLLALLPIGVYFVTPELGRKYYKGLAQRRQLPYRDDYKYFLQPWKNGYDGAQRFAREALMQVEEGAIIYSDSTATHPLLYNQQVNGLREDVKIFSTFDKSDNAPVVNAETVDGLVKSNGFYVVSPRRGYCPGFILENYVLNEKGILWQVVQREKIDR